MNERRPSRATAILIVAYRSPEKLEGCLRSVALYLPGHRLYVWDNSGPEYSGVRVLADAMPSVQWYVGGENIGFAAAVNRLAEAVPECDMLLLNPDAELVGPLTSTLNSLGSPGIAATGPMVEQEVENEVSLVRFPRLTLGWDVARRRRTLLNSLGSAAGLAERFRGTFVSPLYRSQPSEVSGYLAGACLAISRDAWNSVGPFDEEFFLYGEEADWQRRAISAGWRVQLQDEVGIRHSAGGTVMGDPDASMRSQDLLRAHVALELEYQQGLHVAETYLAAATLFEALRQKRRRKSDSKIPPLVVVITVDGSDSDATQERVRLAKVLLADGYVVTVVSLQRLGDLPRRVPTSIRLLRRPWWWPVTSPTAARRVLVAGTTRREHLFGLLFRLGRNRIRLNGYASIGDIARVAQHRKTSPYSVEVTD